MTERSAPHRRFLNPFALPSETDIRFTLIIVAAFALVINIGIGLVTIHYINPIGGNLSGNRIQSLQTDDPAGLPPRAVLTDRLGLFAGIFFSTLILGVGSGLLVLILAVLYYRRYPTRVRRVKQLVSLDPQRQANMLKSIASLAQRARLAAIPRIELGPPGAQGGQAFGSRKNPVLRLGQKMNQLRLVRKNRFDAIVLHELGHIANEDLHRSYFAEAIWRAFLIVMILVTLVRFVFTLRDNLQIAAPDLFTHLDSLFETFFDILIIAVPALVTGAIVLFELLFFIGLIDFGRRGAIRVREIYADWRAVQWGAGDALREILSENLAGRQPTWLRRLFRLHPPVRERLQAIQDPLSLFRLHSDLTVFTGLLFGSVAAGVYSLFYIYQALSAALIDAGRLTAARIQAGGGQPVEAWVRGGAAAASLLGFAAQGLQPVLVFTASLACLFLIVGTVGLQVVRGALADLALSPSSARPGPGGYFRLVLPALILPFAFEIGAFITPYDSISFNPGTPDTWFRYFLLYSGMVILEFVLTWLGLAYLRFSAIRVLGAHVGRSLPPKNLVALLLVGCLQLLILYLPAVILRGLILQRSQDTLLFLLTFLIAPLGFALICLATWAFHRLRSAAFPVHCPTCGARQRETRAVGVDCPACGGELASWLWAEEGGVTPD